jgi:hypothetical protein
MLAPGERVVNPTKGMARTWKTGSAKERLPVFEVDRRPVLSTDHERDVAGPAGV